MSTNYEVTIEMSEETLSLLNEQGYTLYGFKGVVTTSPNAKPSIWFTLTPDSTLTNIQWTSSLYIGKCNVIQKPGGPSISGKSPWPNPPGNPVAIGKAYTYKSGSGWLKDPTDGTTNDAFEIQNHVPGGISNYYVSSTLTTAGSESPIIVVDTLPDGGTTFTPIETVAFILAQKKYEAGTLIVQSFSGGCIVNFVGEANNATITYDPYTNGWDAVDTEAGITFSKFNSGTPLYKEMANTSYKGLAVSVNQLEVSVNQLEARLLSNRQTLASLELYSNDYNFTVTDQVPA